MTQVVALTLCDPDYPQLGPISCSAGCQAIEDAREKVQR